MGSYDAGYNLSETYLTNSAGSFQSSSTSSGTDKTSTILAGIQELGGLAATIASGIMGAKAAGAEESGESGQTTSLTDFQNTIFQQSQGRISNEKISEIFNNNDTDGVQGLSQQELQKAMVEANAEMFNNMTPEEQAADVKADLQVLMQQGKEVKVENGNILVDGEVLNLKDKGASDESIEFIKSEVEKFVASQAGKSQDE